MLGPEKKSGDGRELYFCAFMRASAFWDLGASHSMRRREDVNVNTVSQCKGMCEARRKKNPGDKVQRMKGGVKKGRKEERGGEKMKQNRTRELAERKPGEEESEQERRDIAGR